MKELTQVNVNELSPDEFLETYIEMRDKYQELDKVHPPFVELLNILYKMRVISAIKHGEFMSVINKID